MKQNLLKLFQFFLLLSIFSCEQQDNLQPQTEENILIREAKEYFIKNLNTEPNGTDVNSGNPRIPGFKNPD